MILIRLIARPALLIAASLGFFLALAAALGAELGAGFSPLSPGGASAAAASGPASGRLSEPDCEPPRAGNCAFLIF